MPGEEYMRGQMNVKMNVDKRVAEAKTRGYIDYTMRGSGARGEQMEEMKKLKKIKVDERVATEIETGMEKENEVLKRERQTT